MIKYTIILIFQFPLEKYCPTIVDDIIDGNLQNVAIIINLNGFIGNMLYLGIIGLLTLTVYFLINIDTIIKLLKEKNNVI